MIGDVVRVKYNCTLVTTGQVLSPYTVVAIFGGDMPYTLRHCDCVNEPSWSLFVSVGGVVNEEWNAKKLGRVCSGHQPSMWSFVDLVIYASLMFVYWLIDRAAHQRVQQSDPSNECGREIKVYYHWRVCMWVFLLSSYYDYFDYHCQCFTTFIPMSSLVSWIHCCHIHTSLTSLL